jgi:Initiator Replication protein
VDKIPLNVDKIPLNVDKIPLKRGQNSPKRGQNSPNVDKIPLALEVIHKGKKSVLKASATIAISGDLSLAERRLYNVLYAFAYDRINSETVHRVQLPDVIEALDKTLHRYEEVKAALNALVNVTVSYNILGKDKRSIWGVASLLAGAEIDENGELSYQFPENIKSFLTQPPYAKISIKKQNEIGSAHLLTLYELLTDYYDIKRGYSETGWITLVTLQELFGTSYKDWRDLHKRVVLTQVHKLNADAGDFFVTYRIRKAGRRVVAIKFIMQAREQNEKKQEAPQQLTVFAQNTFAQLKIQQKYRIAGGTDDIFVKASDNEAYNIRTRKTIKIVNPNVAVEHWK